MPDRYSSIMLKLNGSCVLALYLPLNASLDLRTSLIRSLKNYWASTLELNCLNYSKLSLPSLSLSTMSKSFLMSESSIRMP